MTPKEFESHPAYIYAKKVVNKEIDENEDVYLQCKLFMDKLENDLEGDEYFFDYDIAELVTNLTKLIMMASGSRAGTPAHDALAGFQWFFIINVFCWKHNDNPDKRQYENNILLIARKSGKTFLTALVFILLLLIEPRFSEFYSVAPDRELSSMIKKEMEQLIDSSPAISKHFTVLRGEIRCDLKKSKFINLATSNNRMDGRKANVFVADEVGALSNSYPIQAMRSSQMNMLNRTGILISTAYDSVNNPMTEEVEYASKVLHGLIKNRKIFALLYKPDDPKDWLSDRSLLQANPLAVEIPENLEYLKEQRQLAIDIPSKQGNFKTKHMNIFIDGEESEVYIKTDDWKQCKLEDNEGQWDWRGQRVYIGVDLALSGDNTAVTMVGYDERFDKYVMKSWAFIPEDRMEEKTRVEKVDYRRMVKMGYAFACGARTVDYRFIEDFILSLEDKYEVTIEGIGYDKWNATSSMNRIEQEGNLSVIEIPQHSKTLHAPSKWLRELVLNEQFWYEPNELLEINVSNARTVLDNNLNFYINKKKSNGKIDMIAAGINAMVLWLKEVEEGSSYESRGLYVL